MGFKEWIVPQDKVFYELILKQSKKVLEATEIISRMVRDFDKKLVKKRKDEINDVEMECDEMVHEIYKRLNKSFVTPLDHDDITNLVSKYDVVMDLIYTIANRMWLFETIPTPEMERFVTLIKRCVIEIDGALQHMEKLDHEEIEKRCGEINVLENDADELLDSSIAKLFKDRDAVKIIKLKEIYEFMELVTDKCKEISQTISAIAIKNR